MSGHAKIAMCETCPAWRTNGAPEGTCKRMPNGPHTLGTNYCMQHPDNRHLMEPPAKSDGSRLYVGGEVFEPANVMAFVSRSAYDSLMKERDALEVKLEAMVAERDAYLTSYKMLAGRIALFEAAAREMVALLDKTGEAEQ